MFNLPSNFDNPYYFKQTGVSSVPVRRLGAQRTPQSVLTEAGVLGGAGREAVVALTGVAPRGVEAAPVLTDARLGLTLVLICAVSSKDRKQEESSDHFVQEWILSFFLFFKI